MTAISDVRDSRSGVYRRTEAWAAIMAAVADMFEGVHADERRAITYDNCASLYDIRVGEAPAR